MIFQTATRIKRKARISISGVSKSGKTYTALTIAKGLAGKKGKIVLIDTEHGNAALYGDRFNFDMATVEPPYHPDKLINLIHEAESAGYDVLIADSLSHYWEREGGFLDIHNELTEARKDKNSWAAWQDINPIWTDFVDTMLGSKMHIIGTMRSKTDYATDRDGEGRLKIRKVGLKPIMRDGLEYEFDIVASMTPDHYFIVEGTRFPELDGEVIKEPDEKFGKHILNRIEHGKEVNESVKETAEKKTPKAIQSDEAKTKLQSQIASMLVKHEKLIKPDEAKRIMTMLEKPDTTIANLNKTISIINQWVKERKAKK